MRLKLLTRLKIGPSHHNELRFNYDFQSYINSLCSSSLEIVSATYFLLHCHHFSNICSTVLNSISEVLGSITDLSDCIWSKYYYLVVIKVILKRKKFVDLEDVFNTSSV